MHIYSKLIMILKFNVIDFKLKSIIVQATRPLLSDVNIFVIQFGWASENLAGPVHFKTPLARGPVRKNPNVAA